MRFFRPEVEAVLKMLGAEHPRRPHRAADDVGLRAAPAGAGVAERGLHLPDAGDRDADAAAAGPRAGPGSLPRAGSAGTRARRPAREPAPGQRALIGSRAPRASPASSRASAAAATAGTCASPSGPASTSARSRAASAVETAKPSPRAASSRRRAQRGGDELLVHRRHAPPHVAVALHELGGARDLDARARDRARGRVRTAVQPAVDPRVLLARAIGDAAERLEAGEQPHAQESR